ncbi:MULTISPECIES: hypothetical protein [Amycolatopsis]|uniref:hypothetical protein n=1 Tax=Amycolatopsis TaxID=1813 RepID=UPI000B8B2017|nr:MULTISPECIES: hypothetical protein [Amycolatopsis]OXM73866.1 hypothetical protein CF166_08000 [Amycolatopsis sp. KNN50.9b]
MKDLSVFEYRSLLQHAIPQTPDTDTENIHTSTLFTASRHRGALEPDVTVVTGGRGVGKTVWFQTLLNDELRTLAADEYQLPRLLKIDPLAGFGSERNLDKYPSRRVLEELLHDGVNPVDIWTAVALQALGMNAIRELTTWKAKLGWLRSHPEEAESALDKADRAAAETGTIKLFLFDALDRLHENRRSADILTGSILEFALNLRIETRYLRAKVFIRDDMLDSSHAYFPDSSKLTSNAVDLTWSQVDLYGLLFQHLGNAEEEDLAERFRRSTGTWQTKGSRHVPPSRLAADGETQQEVFIRIAGKFMGPNHRRGRTYTWLPNHLADGRGQTSPRSFLAALRTAVDNTVSTYANHFSPLHWDAIKQGVQKASKTRVDEIQEDLPWVASTISPLHGLQVPIEQNEILQRWHERDLESSLGRLVQVPGDDNDVRTGPQHPGDYPRLVNELIALGIMTRRANGKLDLPDVYRIAFGIGRRGGVPRVRA